MTANKCKFLSSNKICVEGAKALGEALHVNGALTELNLDYNYFGLKAAKALREALIAAGTLVVGLRPWLYL